MKLPVRHVFQYIALCIVLCLILALLVFFNGIPNIQKILLMLAGSFYVIWGYIHHYREKSLDLSIIIEYLLYGALGTILVIGLI
jgi:positive regulator of sigma E activity